MRRPAVILIVCTALAAMLLASGASAALQEPSQQKLLERACHLASVRINKIVSEAATKQVLTVRSSVRLLRPGKLAADIAFNPSGSKISVAVDASAPSTMGYGCGYSRSGGNGRSGGLAEGIGVPKQHVVAVMRENVKAPGRYTLTLTLNPKGRRILAHLGAEERAYRKHHPPGKRPPSLTWGVGIHFLSTS